MRQRPSNPMKVIGKLFTVLAVLACVAASGDKSKLVWNHIKADPGSPFLIPSKEVAALRPLRVINGRLFDFTIPMTYERHLTFALDRSWEDKFQFKGKVLQVVDDGLLITPKHGETFLIRNHPRQDELVDGDAVSVWAVPVGPYSYVAVLGSKKTIAAFDCGRPFNPKTDKFDFLIRYTERGLVEVKIPQPQQ